MIRVLLLGEDIAHAAIADALTRAQLHATAHAEGQVWILDNLEEYLFEWEGLIDLAIYREGVRYTTTQKAFAGGQGLGATIKIAGRPLKLRGHFDGEPLKTGAQAWRRALAWRLINTKSSPRSSSSRTPMEIQAR